MLTFKIENIAELYSLLWNISFENETVGTNSLSCSIDTTIIIPHGCLRIDCACCYDTMCETIPVHSNCTDIQINLHDGVS